MDNSQYMNANQAAAFAGSFIMVFWLFALALTVLFIWFYWRIFAKAGFSGALALLNLVPAVGPLICILILAFGDWPALQGRTSAPVQSGYAPPTS